MANSSKKHIGKTSDRLSRQRVKALPTQSNMPSGSPKAASIQLQKSSELTWSGYDSLDQTTREVVEAATRDIQQRLKRTLRDIYYIGKRLNQVREILIPIRGAFSNWVQEEFEVKHSLTVRLSEHWMNIAKRFSEEQIRKFIDLKLPLSALYQVAAPSTPDGVADKIIDTIENTFPHARYRKVPGNLVVQLVQEHREEAERALKQTKLKEAGVIPEVQGILLSSPVAEDAAEIRWLGQFEPTIQSKIAEKLSSGKAKTIQQASSQLETEPSSSITLRLSKQWEPRAASVSAGVAGQGQSSLVEKFASKRRGLQVEGNTQIAYYPGPWQTLIQQVQAGSIDFCFVETPLEQALLSIYPELAQVLFRVLKPGAKALVTAGHRNIQFIGPLLEPPLQISWTYMVQQEPGRNSPAFGSNAAADPVLMSLVYREPWSVPKSMVQTLHTGPSPASNPVIGLEKAICFYLQQHTKQRDTVLHIIVDPQLSFNISSAMIESARNLQYSRLIGIGINGVG